MKIVGRTLTVDEQIAIIDRTIKCLENDMLIAYNECSCICHYFKRGITEILDTKNKHRLVWFADLSLWIPLFTYENALKYGNAGEYSEDSFWWNRDKEGHNQRIAFLNWMKNKLIKYKQSHERRD